MKPGTYKCSYTGGPGLELTHDQPETMEEMVSLVANGEEDVVNLAFAQFTVMRQTFVRTRMKESSLKDEALTRAAQGWSDGYRYAAGRSGERVVDLGDAKISDAVREKLEAAGVKIL